jgi:hypothetical protein
MVSDGSMLFALYLATKEGCEHRLDLCACFHFDSHVASPVFFVSRVRSAETERLASDSCFGIAFRSVALPSTLSAFASSNVTERALAWSSE